MLSDSESEAILWAAAIQSSIPKALSKASQSKKSKEDPGPRLQCGIVIVHRSPKTYWQRLTTISLVHLIDRFLDRVSTTLRPAREEQVPQKTPDGWPDAEAFEEIDLMLDQDVAGRIVCSADVYGEMSKMPIYSYYSWKNAARSPVDQRPPRDSLRNRTRYFAKNVKRSVLTVWRRFRHGVPWECLYDDAQVLLNAPFERVFTTEVRDWVKPSRAKRRLPPTIPFPERPHIDNELVGLALSGGGMRSAVFSVGVMQALACHGFLKDVDYMSTVSGGGYAGAALSALTAEDLSHQGLPALGTGKQDFPFSFPRPDGAVLYSTSPVHGNESPALKHVRENTALYGTKPGLFDAKTWIIAGRYLASTVALWALFLLPILILSGLVGLALHDLMEHVHLTQRKDLRDIIILLFIISLALLFLSVQPSREFIHTSFRRRALAYGPATLVSLLPAGWVAISYVIGRDAGQLWKDWEVSIIGPFLVVGIAVNLLSVELIRDFVHRAIRVLAYAVAAVASALAVALIFGSVTAADEGSDWRDWHVIVGVLSPLVVFGASAVLSNLTDEPSPKWLRDLVLRIIQVLPVASGVLALLLLAAGGVYVFNQLVHSGEMWQQVAAGATAATGAVSAGFSLNKLWGMKLTQALVWRAILGFGGYLVLGFGIVALYWLLWAIIESRSGTSEKWLPIGIGVSAPLVLLALLPFGHPLGRGVLNYFSLHRIYSTMLAKTWVIAAKPEDNQEEKELHSDTTNGANKLPRWTRVWSRDDIRMSHLRDSPKTGPYHLICATLNLPGSTSTKLLDRKADSFVIAPLRSGSALTNWIATELHDELDELHLSQAGAISGAAVSPNAGEHTSRTFSIMTTLLNIRLGRWIRNPRPSQNFILKKWLADAPLILYWKEMLGLASHNDGQIYLSDGGHFENLGLYELFRRRCKYIIAVSADAGGRLEQFDLGNLGRALRLARVDFGVEVDLKQFKPLMHDPQTGFVKTYYAAGALRYPGTNPNDTGVLIFLKTGLCENDLSFDVAEYWMGDNPGFPYDSTLDQQYDQPIFESYRQLGYLAVESMCRDANCGAATKPKDRFEAVLKGYRKFLERQALPPGTDDGQNGEPAFDVTILRKETVTITGVP